MPSDREVLKEVRNVLKDLRGLMGPRNRLRIADLVEKIEGQLVRDPRE